MHTARCIDQYPWSGVWPGQGAMRTEISAALWAFWFGKHWTFPFTFYEE